MSLTLPANYESASKLGNFKENWVCQLFNADSYLSFDGDNDYINLGATTSTSPASLTSTTKLSISMWVNFPIEDVSEWIFVNNSVDNGYSGFSIYKDSTNKFSLIIGDGSGLLAADYRRFRTSTTYSANTWYHVVITTGFANDGSDTIFYVNGSTSGINTDEAGSSAVTTPSYASGNAYFGRGDAADPDSYAQFSIKNFAVYSSLLDQTNITAMYNSGNFKSLLYDFTGYDESSNLKGYWEFNNGEPTIQDLSGNGTNGTIHGATYKDFLPLALSDTAIDSVFYHGCVTRIGSIRDSIDLAKSQAKTSNLSLSLANFKYKGDSLSAELFLGSRDYYNYNVRIYSQLNSASALSDCLQVYQGRLINVAHSQSNVTLQLTEQRPYDNISIPSDKTTDNKIYVPISYGNFTENPASTFASPQFESALTSKAYRPVPFNKTNDKSVLYVDGISTTSSGELAVYEKGVDVFVPLENAVANNGSSVDGTFHDKSDLLQVRAFKQRADSVTQVSNSAMITTTNESRAIDTDATNYATYAVDEQSENSGARVVDLSFGTVSGKSDKHFITLKDADGNVVELAEALSNSETGVDIDDDENVVPYDVIKVDDEEMAVTAVSSDTLTVRRGFGSKKETHDNNESVYFDNTINVIGIKYEVVFTTDVGINYCTLTAVTDGDTYLQTFSGNVAATTVYRNITNGTDSIRLKIYFNAGETAEGGNPDFNAEIRIYDVFLLTQRVSEVPEDMLYVANDGLTESYSGSDGAIEHGHEALRDMLVRFTGFDTADPDGWSALHTDRHISTWAIRWWAIEPIELKSVLNRMMSEFGFIFKFRADGTGRVIHIIQTSEMQTIADSGSPYPILKSSDIRNVSISTSSFDSMVTKMDINYEKHPAGNNYVSEVTSTNDTSRLKYRIKSKENIKKENLDMNVGTPNTTGQTDPNTDFYSYYDNILGDIKKIVKCDIVNPAKSYAMETGDIIQFSSTAGEMPVDPFGHGWDQNGYDFYMITKLVRSVGSVKIECREVG